MKEQPSKNKGVEARSRRDEEELQKVLDPSAVLEQKMQRYRSMGTWPILFLTLFHITSIARRHSFICRRCLPPHHRTPAVRDGFRDEKEQFLVDFEQKKWDGSGADEETGAAGLDALLAAPPAAAAASGGDELAEEARRLEESVRRDLAGTDAKSSAEALLAKRREAARRRMAAAAAAAGQPRAPPIPPPPQPARK